MASSRAFMAAFCQFLVHPPGRSVLYKLSGTILVPRIFHMSYSEVATHFLPHMICLHRKSQVISLAY
jgi:hypothetical protein